MLSLRNNRLFKHLHLYLISIYMHLRNIFSFSKSLNAMSNEAISLVANLHLMTQNQQQQQPSTPISNHNLDTDSEVSSDALNLQVVHKNPSDAPRTSLNNEQQPTYFSTSALAVSNLLELLPSVRWRPTSEDELANLEASILSYLNRPYKSYYVDLPNIFGSQQDAKINTIEMLSDSEIQMQKQELTNHDDEAISYKDLTSPENKSSDIKTSETFIKHESNLMDIDDPEKNSTKLPLVLIHGFAAGIGFWILNLDELASKLSRKVYAFDILGFARSSRVEFDLNKDVEQQFVDSIEGWRQSMKLDKFILLGHSFGGYLSANYALRHPERVAHLILADPWGVSDKQGQGDTNRMRYMLPIHVRTVNNIFQRFNPLAILRATGPYGPRLVHAFRPDLKEKFRSKLKDDSDRILDYIYHCNAQTATGESAFKSLSLPYGWAKNPLVSRLLDLDSRVSLSLIYGSRSWIDKSPGEFIRECLGSSRVGYYVINGAGHHVYADKFSDFNDLVKEICTATND